MKKLILIVCILITSITMAQCYTSATNYTAGKGAQSVTTADFNRDGKMDLAIANATDDNVSILLGIGLGVFSAPTNFTVGQRPYKIINGDFNGDGKMDLATANVASNNISILLGNGLGSFSSKNFNTSARSITCGDFNGDGKLDLATTSFSTNNVGVLLGNGSGSFSASVTFAVGTGPISVVCVDFNGDRKLDLAIANYTSNNVSVLLGNGLGSFSAPVNFAVGTRPRTVIYQDFNADGKMDLATANEGSANSSILLGDGMGNFGVATPVGITGVNYPSDLFSSDLNGDGIMDLAVTNEGSTNLSVFFGNGSGGFLSGNNFIVGARPQSVVGADFNGDGKFDLVTANSHSTSDNVSVLLGDVRFTIIQTAVTCNGGSNGTATAEVNCGQFPYSYLWNSTPPQSTKRATGLSAGSYTVTVKDSAGASRSTTVIITQPAPLSAIVTSTPNSKCSGICNGSATVVSVTSGKPPYTYQWDANTGNQTSATASALCQGSYSVVIKDANNCSVTELVKVNVETTANANIYLTNLAAIDQISVSPAFTSYYTYSLPAKITPNPTNLRNFVDPGKKARFKVECTNKKTTGQSIVSGICEVRSNSPYITITDASSALNNIGWNNKAWSADEFEIDIKPNTPPGTIAYIDFIVKENGIEYVTSCIPLPITPLNYSLTNEFTIDDDNNPDSKGNDNDKCEPNEIIEFYPWLDNVSALDAEYVRGRFENLDNLSYINIWNNKSGVNTTVFDTTWWNFSFGKPSIINSNSLSTTPEYDFVFNYNNTSTVNNFKLYLVMAGGFKLFPGNALSLVQWTLPYTFNNEALTITDFLQNNNLKIYPNPTAKLLNIQVSDNQKIDKIIITDLTGKQVLQQNYNTTPINVQNLAKGMYVLEVFVGQNKETRKFIKD